MRDAGEGQGESDRMRAERAAWIVFWVFLLTITAWLIHLGQGTTFFRDDWSVIVDRDGASLGSYMSAHGGQMIPGQVLVFITGLKLFGFDDYGVFRVVTLPLLLGCAVLMYVIGRRRMGPWFALAPALAIPLMGGSYLTMLWPLVTMTFAGTIFFSLSAFLALERRTTAGDIGACSLLLVAMSLSGVTLAFLAGAVVGVVFVVQRDFRRLWIPAVPAIAYLLWSHFYGTQEIHLADAIASGPAFIGNMAVGAIEGLTGFSGAIAVLATIFTLGLIAVRLFQLRGESLLAWQAAATLLAFWVLTVLARTGVSDPKTSRYIFPSAFLIILILVAVAPRANFRMAYGVVGTVLVLIFLPHGINELRDGSDSLRRSASYVRAEFGAAEIGREAIDPAVTLQLSTYPIVAGNYFSAVDRYDSSPAMTPDELESATPIEQKFADRMLADAQGIDGGPDGNESNSAYVKSHGLTCRILDPGETASSNDLSRSPLTALGRDDDLVLTLRRFADTPDVLPSGPGMTGRRVLSAPRDSLGDPAWRGAVTATNGSIQACEKGGT